MKPIALSLMGYALLATSLIAPVRMSAQDLTPESTTPLEWESYALRWGQIVTEDGVRRPGINTIHDTLRVMEEGDGSIAIDRHLLWKDIYGAWRSFRRRMTPELVPIQGVQRSDGGGTNILEWSSDGTVRYTGYNAASASVASQSSTLTPGLHFGFTRGQYGLEFRHVPPESNGGRIWIDGPFGRDPEWVEFEVREEVDLPNLMDFQGPYRVFRTGAPGAMQTEYWLIDRAPYVVKVRFEQPEGIVTEWVMTAFETLEDEKGGG